MNDRLELRRNWRTRWLGSIQKFADYEEQRRRWLDPTNANPAFNFVEYFCSYFDDLDLSDGGYVSAENEGWVSSDEVAAVTSFHAIADAYESPTDDYDHQAVLSDPKWADVVAAAQHARIALLSLVTEPDERRLLRES